jgi:tetratricopeptide (TPR) repeat protein/tRNA A-37 threonylcarbamoyl transferase component Bud32
MRDIVSEDEDPTSPHSGPEFEARNAGSIPGYELLTLVHRGGQGAVYRAIQVATRRVVAVKVLRAGSHASEQERRRFERELDILASLEHPRVVSLLDGGIANGLPFLVMRFVEGEDLDRWTARERPGARRSARIVAATCRAVEHAHARGVLHRDIKPSNVRVDSAGDPHVLDFGLAAPLRLEGDADPSSLTMDGVFLGTLAHAAPEQLRADPSRVDVRTDVHGLGVLLFWMLTGELPHPLAGDLAEALARISREDPRSPRSLRPALDRDIETITLKAMARDPERRYQTVQALREDLERWLAGDAIAARRDSRLYVLRKACRRHATLLSTAVIVFVLLAGALVAVLTQRNAAREAAAAASRAADEARRAAEAARIEAATSQRLSDALTNLLQLPQGQGNSAGREEMTVADAIRDGAERVLPGLQQDPDVQARVAGVLGRALLSLGHWGEAQPMLETAVAHYRKHPGVPLEMLRAVTALAQHHQGEGRYEESEAWYREAVAMARANRADLPVAALPKALANLAMAVARDGCSDEQRSLLEEAIRITAAEAPEDRLLHARLVVRLPDEESRTLDEQHASRGARIAMLRSAVGKDDIGVSDALEAQGVEALYGQRPDLAMGPLIEGLMIRERLLPPPHPFRAEARSNLAHCLDQAGDRDEARRLFESALAEYAATGTSDTSGALQAREALAGYAAATPGR